MQLKEYQRFSKKMKRLKLQGGQRDWEYRHSLKEQLDLAYREEEEYWSQKTRVHWLQEGDKNTQFFHASTTQRRKKDMME